MLLLLWSWKISTSLGVVIIEISRDTVLILRKFIQATAAQFHRWVTQNFIITLLLFLFLSRLARSWCVYKEERKRKKPPRTLACPQLRQNFIHYNPTSLTDPSAQLFVFRLFISTLNFSRAPVTLVRAGKKLRTSRLNSRLRESRACLIKVDFS